MASRSNKGPRAAGTDGADHSYRQQVDGRYGQIAGIRKVLNTIAPVNIAYGVISFVGILYHLYQPQHGLVPEWLPLSMAFGTCVMGTALTTYIQQNALTQPLALLIQLTGSSWCTVMGLANMYATKHHNIATTGVNVIGGLMNFAALFYLVQLRSIESGSKRA